MPVTPKFTISQDDEYVYIRINVPHIKVSEAEMITEGCDFSFYCKPYLLKLTFPGEFDNTDEEKCRSTYDPYENNGTITSYLPKLIRGQHFPDLDLTTTLLQKRIQKDVVPGLPLIEVIQSNEDEGKDEGGAVEHTVKETTTTSTTY